MPTTAYPAVLATLTGRAVVNAGVPGDTTATGLARLPAVLDEHQPRLVLLCLGGNDMLRKQSESATENNLRLLVQTIRASGAERGADRRARTEAVRRRTGLLRPRRRRTWACRWSRTSSTTC